MNIGKTSAIETTEKLPGLLAPTKNVTRTIIIAIIGVLLVIIVGLIIKNTRFDFGVVHFLNQLHHGKVGSITSAVYKVFGPTFAIIGTVVLTGLVLLYTRSIRGASTFAATIAGTWLSLAIVKLIVDRVRPDSNLLPHPFNPILTDASYPSGHTAFVVALVAIIVMGFALGWQKWVAGIVGGLVIVFVGLSLMIDGVHYPSDVIASIVWALTLAPFVRYVWVSIILKFIDSRKTKA